MDARKEWALAHREKIREAQRKYRESHPEHANKWGREHPEEARAKTRRDQAAHPERWRGYARKYRESHREELLIRGRARYEANRDKMRAAAREGAKRHPEWNRRNARKRRSSHREEYILRRILKRTLRSADISKTQRARKYIGCNPVFLRNHIEEQFQSGMTWENYGTVWHIDHIVPLSWWDLKNHPEHLWDASHYSNLQPLFGVDNMAKGARRAG